MSAPEFLPTFRPVAALLISCSTCIDGWTRAFRFSCRAMFQQLFVTLLTLCTVWPSSNILTQSCGLCSHRFDIVFCRAETFTFNKVQLISYFFHGSYFICLKRHHIQSRLGFLLCFLLGSLAFCISYLVYNPF